MATKRLLSRLHLLTVRQVQTAGDGDHTDGGGLLLRIRGASASWVFRYTAPTGKRREMGLGVAHRSNPAHAGASLTAARDLAFAARDQLARNLDPIDEREKVRDAGREAERLQKAQKVRQRMFGSTPLISTTSRSVPGGRQCDTRIEGHRISLVTPSIWRITGRFTW